MKRSKKNIKKRILFSQISIIVVSLLLTAIVFNIALQLYIRKQTRTQLISAGTLLHKSIASDLSTLNLKDTGKENLKNDNREVSRAMLRISKTLKQTQFLLDINYAVIGKDKSVLYPNDNKEDDSLLSDQIMPALNKRVSNINTLKPNRIFYFTANNKDYASIFFPIKLEANKNLGYLFLYSDLSQSDRFIFAINIILFTIILFTALIGFVVSNLLANRISEPITKLGEFAKQVGDREYKLPKIDYQDDEIGQLASTMTTMAEKISAYDNTIKTFLQNSSHELRTPLMSIQGYAEGIKYGVVENETDAVDIIIDESKRLSALVEDLLYLSKLDSMQDTINLETVNVENLIRSCIERVNGIAINSGKVIKLTESNKDICLNVDEEKLSRAVINILGNCLRYSMETIEVALRKSEDRVTIEIKDDGPGFDNSDLDKLFERFYKGKGGKYGLGLAIAKTIVEKHRGTISAENSEKGGAVFRIVI